VRRTLIAGFGNVLRGDDGFGVEIIRRLEALPLPPEVTLMEIGTAGLRLAQELLSPYDHLIIVDAMTRGGTPGSLYALRVDDVAPVTEVDMHAATPSRALAIAKALGGLPAAVHLIGCEPNGVDDLGAALSPAVQRAIPPTLTRILALMGSGVEP
jgi:hydrogenase maturation protease